MIGIYFSGTGNTKHCVEKFVQCFDTKNKAYSIETETAILANLLKNEDVIVFGHPTCFSNAHKIVRDFIFANKQLFERKQVFIICTMGLFSGDGAGCSARIFRKIGAQVVGGLHLKMPDSVGDCKALKRSLAKNQNLVRLADLKIQLAAERLKSGKPLQNGLNIFYHIAGLLGQRLWFYGESASYKAKPQIDLAKCSFCGLCIKNCPMQNLSKKNGKIINQKRCTMCYRCLNNCPQQAITILGKKVYEQCLYEKYEQI